MNEWNHPGDPRYPTGYPQDPGPGKKSKWLAALLAFLVPGLGHFYLGQMVKGIAIMLLIAMDICAIVFAAIHLDNVLIIVLLSLLMPIIYFYNLFDAIQSTDTVNEKLFRRGWAVPSYGMPPAPGPAAFVPGRPAPAGEAAPPAAAPTDPAPAQPQLPVDPFPGHEGTTGSINRTGMILLAAGAIVLLLAADIGWTDWLFRSSGSMVGAIILIGAGIGLWFWEMRGQNGRRG